MAALVIFALKTENLLEYKDQFKWLVLLLIIAVMMFYYSISSSLISLSKKNKNYYYKGYNTLKCRQTARNLGKNMSAMAILSLSLALVIMLAVVSGSSMKAMDKSLEEAGPYDITVI